jgi:hypothetical protein
MSLACLTKDEAAGPWQVAIIGERKTPSSEEKKLNTNFKPHEDATARPTNLTAIVCCSRLF